MRLFNLKALILNNNEITELENLKEVPELTTLILANNQIEEIKNLEKLKNINKLSLSHNNLHVIYMENLKLIKKN